MKSSELRIITWLMATMETLFEGPEAGFCVFCARSWTAVGCGCFRRALGRLAGISTTQVQLLGVPARKGLALEWAQFLVVLGFFFGCFLFFFSWTWVFMGGLFSRPCSGFLKWSRHHHHHCLQWTNTKKPPPNSTGQKTQAVRCRLQWYRERLQSYIYLQHNWDSVSVSLTWGA